MLVQSLSAYRSDNKDTMDDNLRRQIEEFFGSLEQTALSLYQCTTGGMNWIDIYRIVSKVGAFETTAFIFFIGFFGFAVVTILSGIFIEKALCAAQPDRESMALEQRRLDESETAQLKDLLSTIDKEKRGKLRLEEFTCALDDMHVQAYLRSLGLAVNDANMFFHLLVNQSGTDELPIDDFAQRMCRMKGNATSMDLQSLMFEVSLIRKMVLELAKATASAKKAHREKFKASVSAGDFAPGKDGLAHLASKDTVVGLFEAVEQLERVEREATVHHLDKAPQFDQVHSMGGSGWIDESLPLANTKSKASKRSAGSC
jgi:hypothetical protein